VIDRAVEELENVEEEDDEEDDDEYRDLPA